MIRDLEGAKIKLSDIPNGHRLLVGKSGCGKTFAMFRLLEEALEEQKECLLIDFSGGFSKCERDKACFGASVHEIDLYRSEFHIYVAQSDIEETVDMVVHALLATLGITSYFQKNILKLSVKNCLHMSGKVSVPLLIKSLEKKLGEAEDKDVHDNTLRLLTRLAPYENLGNLTISHGGKNEIGRIARVQIMQLSGFSELSREFITDFLLELIWIIARSRRQSNIFTRNIFMDEIQNLSFKKGGAMHGLLKEGRKFGASLTLATQVLSSFDKEQLNTLLQAGNILFFRPTSSDIRIALGIMSGEHHGGYGTLLRQLKRGECLLAGFYHRNDSQRVCTSPLLCKVIKEKRKTKINLSCGRRIQYAADSKRFAKNTEYRP